MFNEAMITQRMRGMLIPKIEQAFEVFISENHLTKVKIYPEDIPGKLLESYLPAAVKEFQKVNQDVENSSADEIDDRIADYVLYECDIGFLLSKIQFIFDEEATLQGVRDTMIEMLQNTSPYDQVHRDYWVRKVNKVRHVHDLAKYADRDHLDAFVEEKAADWKENLQEE